MDVKVDPPQPEPVEQAIAGALATDKAPAVDPWWRAGTEENLRAE